ncbi:MAG: hypothetical protein E6J17_00370 [Chloroflexi bacterium]|nr:MAG: hypothetical protein E6J17_00370 [Chloroflexota bacterium]
MQQLWNCAKCHSLNEATTKRCYRCRAERATHEYVDPRGSPEGPGVAADPPRDPSILGASIFGVAAAGLAIAAWYWLDGASRGYPLFGRYYYWLGIIVGVVVGFGTTLGGRGRTSFPIVLLSVGLTFLALVVGEYLLVSRYLAGQFNAPSSRIILIQPSDVIAGLPNYLKLTPLRPLTWIGAVLAAFIEPWYRLVGRTDRRDD